MAKIIIRRKKSFIGAAQNHTVYLLHPSVGDIYIGELKNGEVVEFSAEVGIHILLFKSTLKSFGQDTTFNVVINDENEVVELKTRFGASNYIVEYADGKIHYPKPSFESDSTQSNSSSVPPNDSNVTIDKNNSKTVGGLRCHRCGSNDITPVTETTTTGKDFDAKDACCGFLLCGPIGVLCGAMGKGKQTNSTTYWLCKGCGNKFKA